MLKEFKRVIQKQNLIKRKDKLLVGVSGGPDSVCLLHLLNAIKKEYNLKLFIAHLDHMIRRRSYKDAQFVMRLAKKIGLPFYMERINIKQLAKKASLEQEARNIRYDFFFRLARQLKINKIVLGHNKDDQAETVLMRIIRGTGLYGLAGILPKRRIKEYTIIRPLLWFKRKDIAAYLKKRKISSVVDITNKQDRYFRNRIRNKFIPQLRRINTNIDDALFNLAETSGLDYEFIQESAQKRLKSISRKNIGKKIKIDLNRFKKEHPAIERMIFRLAIQRLKGDMRRFRYQHWRELEDLICNRPIGSIVHLPAKIRAVKNKGHLLIAIDNKKI